MQQKLSQSIYHCSENCTIYHCSKYCYNLSLQQAAGGTYRMLRVADARVEDLNSFVELLAQQALALSRVTRHVSHIMYHMSNVTAVM